MASFKFIQWLVDWIESQSHFAFEWDLGNRTKNFVKHGITIQQAQSVFEQPEAIRVLGEQAQPSVSEPRYGILGLTSELEHVLFASRFGGLESGLSIFDK
jgi:uncharacterized DUF497 family protein